MVKPILVGVAFFLAVLAAFYGGVFIGRAKPDPPPGVTPPTPDSLIYPGSNELKRSGDAKNFLVVLTTPDDFDTVAHFYRQLVSSLTGVSNNGFDPKTLGSSGGGGGLGSYRIASDSTQPDGKSRKVRILTFEVRQQGHNVNVFVNRVDGESHTHITLSLEPKEPQ
jgi:hypothetical protein